MSDQSPRFTTAESSSESFVEPRALQNFGGIRPDRAVWGRRLGAAARTGALLAFLGGGTLACVSSGTHNKTLAELAKVKKDAALDAENKDNAIKEREALIAERTRERDELSKQLDDTTALVGELQSRLEKLGQDAEALASEKGALASGLAQARERLEELRRQKAAAEQRAAEFRGLISRLRAMIDAGKIQVTIRDGRMLIALPNDVLFDSGKTELKTEGQQALQQVAEALAAIPDRKFLVAGHTDNVPIKTRRFPSNWELSTARAVEVTRLLIEYGMSATVLAAAGYGEFDPVAENDTPENKALNRRIEIVLLPNLSDLPSLNNISE